MTKKTLVKESVIRRWGKLANMAPLTETWLDTISEEEGEEEAAADEMAAGEAEVEAGGDMEASAEDMEAVESIVNAVVDAIAQETGVEIEVEGGSDEEAALDADADAEAPEADALELDAAMRDEAPHDRGDEQHNRSPYNRTDDLDEKKKPAHKNTKSEKDADEGHDATEDKDKAKGKFGDGSMKKEELEIDVIDDEALTEAVLKRVVERLLRRK
jgi:hypothetical protein